jgi:hypothetical protein
VARFFDQNDNQCDSGDRYWQNSRGFTHSSGFYSFVAGMQVTYPKDSLAFQSLRE